MERTWFLTWRTYGTWLPGDERGFVGPVVNNLGHRVINNAPGDPMDGGNPALANSARNAMLGNPIYLDPAQAKSVFEQIQETAQYRGWELLAVAVLPNHVHVVVGVPGDPEPDTLLRDFKSYASRRLNRQWSKPRNGSWWAESGSRQKVESEANLQLVVNYVGEQPGSLVMWVNAPRVADRLGERPA